MKVSAEALEMRGDLADDRGIQLACRESPPSIRSAEAEVDAEQLVDALGAIARCPRGQHQGSHRTSV
jgi:hypothetical protein